MKPNETKSPLQFVPSRVLTQLHSLSILEALQLRNLGYCYRRPFEEFLFQYRFVDLGVAESKDFTARQASERLLKSAGISTGWQIGKTMVFMKSEAVKEITRKQRQALASWTPLVEIIEAMAVKRLYRQKYDKFSEGLVRVQARCRQ